MNELKDLSDKMNVDTMSESDVKSLKDATEALKQEFYKISEKLYQQQAAAGDAQGAAPNGDPNVVDGEFTEKN